MTIREILKEFGKGCSCGAPGECETCLDSAVSAIEKRMFEMRGIVIEKSIRTGKVETITRIYE